MDYDSVPTPKFPESLLTEYKCLIDGEEYPLVVGQVLPAMNTVVKAIEATEM